MKNFYTCDCNVIHQEIVDKVVKLMAGEDVFTKLATFYKIIGDNTRCKILYALSLYEMCVCDLSNVLNMTKSSISHQLAKLRKYNVVKSRRVGKSMYYSLDDDHVAKIYETSLKHIIHTV